MTYNYNIEYLPSFDEELDEILYYIIHKLKNKQAAKKLLENVSNSIIDRSVNAESFEVYNSIKKRKYKWYRIYVGNYTIFYTVVNKTMKISHIIYEKRNIHIL